MKHTTASTTDVHDEFEAAKKAVLEAYASFLDAKIHLKKAAVAAGIDLKESANEHLDEAIAMARDKKNELHDSASDYVLRNPVTSAGLAFLGGVVFSKLFGK
jgi:gamma-glutamyl:cysteine ligase YbdK (ATP-grasp superfamily)